MLFMHSLLFGVGQLPNSYTCIQETDNMIHVALLRLLVGLSLAH